MRPSWFLPRSSSSTRTAFARLGPACHAVPQRHRYYAVLRLPRSVGRRSGSPRVRPTAPCSSCSLAPPARSLPTRREVGWRPAGIGVRVPCSGASCGESWISQVAGPPSFAAPWSNTPPGASVPRPISDRTPSPSGGMRPSAPGNAPFRSCSPTARSLACLRIDGPVTVTAARLASRSPGSAFRGGIRTRWATNRIS